MGHACRERGDSCPHIGVIEPGMHNVWTKSNELAREIGDPRAVRERECSEQRMDMVFGGEELDGCSARRCTRSLHGHAAFACEREVVTICALRRVRGEDARFNTSAPLRLTRDIDQLSFRAARSERAYDMHDARLRTMRRIGMCGCLGNLRDR